MRKPTVKRFFLVAGLGLGAFLVSLNALGSEALTLSNIVQKHLQPPDFEGEMLVWVLPKDAYSSCRKPTYALRRIQSAHGGSLPLIVVHEPREDGAVRHVLARQRLSADLHSPKAPDHEQFFDSSREPSLHLFRGRTEVFAWEYERDGVPMELGQYMDLSLLEVNSGRTAPVPR